MSCEQLISIVLCNYNYAAFIGEAIDSVLVQDYSNWELVIVDDGSTDHSREIIELYSRKHPERIRVLFKENEGQGMGFNDGVSLAQGDVICFLDSDDIWLPGKLSMVANWFAKHDDIALLQHDMRIMRGDTPTDEHFRALMGCGNLLEEARRTRQLPQYMPTSGLAIHRQVLEKVLPIPAQFRTCADGYLTRTCMCHGTVYAEPGTYGYYRRHGENCVLGNTGHNSTRYINTLLVPHLNAYYRKNGIDLEFPTPRFRLDTAQHVRKIKSLKPWERLRCSNGFETARGTLSELGLLIDPTDWRIREMRNAFAGQECHILGRATNPDVVDWDAMENCYVFVADTCALIPQVRNLSRGMYCISDLRFWEGRWGVSPNMRAFLEEIPTMQKLFELPARPRRREFPKYSPKTYLFKTVNRDFGIWKGNVTLDATKRLMWGYHVVLDMCLPMAFHMGFAKVTLHGCNWDFLDESQRLRDFFTLYCHNNDYNLSENILPFSTAHGRTDLLWEQSFQKLTAEYGSRGMKVIDS